ncbi:MAG: outer membrane beta-barrel protein [Gammaproteobacteria bacterium]|nr:outer membrane beta-barrel protein [Gammaproteobacteria bacterium]
MNKNNSCKYIVFGLIIVIFPAILNAGERNQTNSDGQAVTTSLLIQYSYDDNLLSDQNEIIEANILTVAPDLVIRAGSGNSRYKLNFNGEIAKYDGSSEDNYEDIGLSATANYEFTSRHRLNLLALYSDGHDNRGRGYSQGSGIFLSEVDTFNQTDFTADYSFGRLATIGQFNFSIDSSDINYDPRYFQGEDYTKNRERSQITSTLQFLYAITAKMAFQANAYHRDTAYDYQSDLDSSEDGILMGISWQGTAKVTGSSLVGYSDRSSDNGLSDQKGGIWQVDLTWKPKTYASLNLTTSKTNQETTGLGNFSTVTSSGLSWNHQWKSRLSSNLSVHFTDVNYDGTGVNQDTTSFQAGLDYQLRNWLNIKLAYTNTSRDTNSEIVFYSFDKEIISISFLIVI